MRKQVHRLCVEISQDSHGFVNISGELLQLFRLGFGGDIGGKAATSNVKSPRRRLPARACPSVPIHAKPPLRKKSY